MQYSDSPDVFDIFGYDIQKSEKNAENKKKYLIYKNRFLS